MKHKHFNRLLSMLLVIATLFGILAVPASAATLESSGSVTIQQAGYGNYLSKSTGGTIGGGYWKYTSNNGLTGTAYCVNHGLKGVSPSKALTVQPYNREPKTMGTFANGYVSESGELAGRSAARFAPAPRREVEIHPSPALLYAVPQRLDLNQDNSKTTLYFRSREVLDRCVLRLSVNGQEIFSKRYPFLRPPEMERLDMDFSQFELDESSKLELNIEVMDHE